MNTVIFNAIFYPPEFKLKTKALQVLSIKGRSLEITLIEMCKYPDSVYKFNGLQELINLHPK